MADDTLVLRAGALELGLSPSVGGTIAWFDEVAGERRSAILRGCHTPLENALGAASFPLVPYVNRIRGGTFAFRGRDIAIAPNMAGDPSPLHGDGWLGPWQVEQKAARNATLHFHHDPGEWPWEYEARQVFALDPRGLTLTLECRNLSAEPMPCGLGQHPYFPCGAATRIDTHVSHAWTIDDQVLPVDKVEATGRFDLAGRPVCGQNLDHGFGGWSGSALLTDPAWPFALELSSPTARFFQLYSPDSGGLFVAEPVTHANAALNAPEAEWAELGMAVLEPGEAMTLAMRLEVTPR
ncbi:aldose 1-epimerase [Sphingomonas sp.]|uniref:aldose 1-epimerase n=1 Tax=Sphingomonas sp. TaxID=28214 RepID=UPI00286DA2BD|nr:aldose 1-epimerase [Sphingomonas sp.]